MPRKKRKNTFFFPDTLETRTYKCEKCGSKNEITMIKADWFYIDRGSSKTFSCINCKKKSKFSKREETFILEEICPPPDNNET